MISLESQSSSNVAKMMSRDVLYYKIGMSQSGNICLKSRMGIILSLSRLTL
jgi:hypothetical protein